MTGKCVMIDVLSTAFMTGGRKSIEARMRKKNIILLRACPILIKGGN